MLLSLFLVTQISIVLSASSCMKYQCSTSSSTCISFDLMNLALNFNPNICKSGQVCDSSSMACKTIENETNRLPGRKCSVNSDCMSSNCLSGVCKGLTTGSSCMKNTQCDVGLYCGSSKCASLLSYGAACGDDSDCSYGLGCHYSTCTSWASIPVGSATDPSTCKNYRSDFCSTGQCYPSNVQQAICINPFTYASGDLVTCTSNTNCVANSGTYSITGTCSCGMNTNGDQYCDVMFGSSYGRKLWSIYSTQANSTAAKSSHKAEDPVNMLKDWGSSSDYNTILHYTIWASMGEDLQGASSCMVLTMFPQYSDAILGSYSGAILVSIGIVGLIIA